MKLLIYSLVMLIVAYTYYRHTSQPQIDKPLSIGSSMNFGNKYKALFTRRSNGLLEIDAVDHQSFAAALGYAHVHDRFVQIFTLRLAAQGRLSECLAPSEETLAIDTLMKQTGFYENAKRDIGLITDKSILQRLSAYADGVNYYVANNNRPLEFVLANYHPEPWTIVDSLAITNIVGYMGLASGQAVLEKFIIHGLKSKSTKVKELMKRLYAPYLDDFDTFVPESILNVVKVEQPMVPNELKLFESIPQLVGSNNWIVGSSKSTSGKPLMGFDPHLEISKLPGFWYETIAKIKSDGTFATGVTLPGAHGFVMGRNNENAMSFTYGFADMIDYFIEDCKNMKCKDGEEYVPVTKSVHVIKRKGMPDVEVVVFKTSNGILELSNSSRHDFDDGFYLSRAYTHDIYRSAVGSLEGIASFYAKRTIADLEKAAEKVEISMNLLTAAADGGMAYIQTALIPKRPHSGLFPLLGWKKEHKWTGLVPGEKLHRIYNPESDILATSNNEHNGDVLAVNAHMGSSRVGRSLYLLKQKEKYSPSDMKTMQYDVYSIQAKEFMDVLTPVLKQMKSSRVAQELLKWDFQYKSTSKGAYLFEMWYRELLKELYGDLVGPGWESVSNSAVFILYYHYLDRLIVADYSPSDVIWKGRTREDVFRIVVERIDQTTLQHGILTYGQYHTITFSNQFFENVLPIKLQRFLGMTLGPYPFEGSRGSLQQAQKFTQGKMSATFGASIRCVADLATESNQCTFPGGPSGNFLSKLYANELVAYFSGEYKTADA